jgi:hypothetical protein
MRTDEPSPPAGWSWDATKRHNERFWDGRHWTDRVRDGDNESLDPVHPHNVPARTSASPPGPQSQFADDVSSGVKGAFSADNPDVALSASAAAVVGATLKALGRKVRRAKGST